ncbi:MAG TPA: hypothetical protein VG713_09345 [Pirellulales bacterium]|nr:hypothetical protein [Pirellulales bacterium]
MTSKRWLLGAVVAGSIAIGFAIALGSGTSEMTALAAVEPAIVVAMLALLVVCCYRARRAGRTDGAIDLHHERLERAISEVIRGQGAKLAVERLVDELSAPVADSADRRTEIRRPTQRRFVTLTTCDTSRNWAPTRGWLKDINMWGIGFDHETELPLGPAVMTFTVNGKEMSLEVNIRWTRMIASRWFNSGSYFVAMDEVREAVEQMRNEQQLAELGEIESEAIDDPAAAASASRA